MPSGVRQRFHHRSDDEVRSRPSRSRRSPESSVLVHSALPLVASSADASAGDRSINIDEVGWPAGPETAFGVDLENAAVASMGEDRGCETWPIAS